jgi:hypothetical protein
VGKILIILSIICTTSIAWYVDKVDKENKLIRDSYLFEIAKLKNEVVQREKENGKLGSCIISRYNSGMLKITYIKIKSNKKKGRVK